MSEWQDISTAPKDGTEILVAGPAWDDLSKGFFQTVAMWIDHAWFQEQTDYPDAAVYDPTHWQPLPEPPSQPLHTES